MLRRAILLLLLAAPAGAFAQVTFTPTSLGKADCTDSTDKLTLTWTSTVTVSGQTFAANSDKYGILVSQATGCPTTDSTTTEVVSQQLATTLTGQQYQLARDQFLSTAGADCTVAKTLYVCVTLYGSDGTTVKGSAVTGSIKVSLTPPPVPVSVSVSPGDSALYVSWAAGPTSESTVAADHYEVTMTVKAGTDPTVRSAQSFTGTSGRFTGLVNGVTYGAQVSAVSAAGNASAFTAITPASTGTPAPVSDFWDAYKASGGLDTGGCAGGAGGLLSLLGVAALARTFRRRS